MSGQAKILPTGDLLRSHFQYDAELGALRWIARSPGSRVIVGSIAGGRGSNGYIYVSFFNTKYLLHRLIWAFHHGDVEAGLELDHIDGNQLNNRIENLRLATRAQQNYNKAVHRNCISGLKGAHFNGPRTATASKPWHSQIVVAGKIIFLGCFSTPEKAHTAYVEATQKYCGGFGRIA